ncbi:MAG: class I SAM-dependent methyltransferase [Acidobacteriota bacterium]|nr:class I SAM-dependent methyltransferase [Acidobacteriota bacterium]
MSEWDGYILEDYEFGFAPRSVVIDVGCGEGIHVAKLISEGHFAIGIDLDASRVSTAARSRFVQARAEALPFRNGCADGVLIKVVLPYVDDRRAIAEIARVLKAGGRCFVVGHGPGYSLRYLLRPSDWRVAVYGLRTLVNSAVFFVTGRRLPGFWGDTVMQTSKHLNTLYRNNGMALTAETLSRSFLGFPVFIYHHIRKLPGGQ